MFLDPTPPPYLRPRLAAPDYSVQPQPPYQQHTYQQPRPMYNPCINSEAGDGRDKVFSGHALAQLPMSPAKVGVCGDRLDLCHPSNPLEPYTTISKVAVEDQTTYSPADEQSDEVKLWKNLENQTSSLAKGSRHNGPHGRYVVKQYYMVGV